MKERGGEAHLPPLECLLARLLLIRSSESSLESLLLLLLSLLLPLSLLLFFLLDVFFFFLFLFFDVLLDVVRCGSGDAMSLSWSWLRDRWCRVWCCSLFFWGHHQITIRTWNIHQINILIHYSLTYTYTRTRARTHNGAKNNTYNTHANHYEEYFKGIKLSMLEE